MKNFYSCNYFFNVVTLVMLFFQEIGDLIEGRHRTSFENATEAMNFFVLALNEHFKQTVSYKKFTSGFSYFTIKTVCYVFGKAELVFYIDIFYIPIL